MSEYVIRITLKNVAEADATDLAQEIWDENARPFDAENGEFAISVSRDGFAVEWDPSDG